MEIVDDAVVLVHFCLCKLSISHNVWFRSTKNHLVESTSDLNKSIKNNIMKLKHPKYKKYFGRELFCCWDDVRKIFLPHFGHPDYAQYLPLPPTEQVYFWNNIEMCQFRPRNPGIPGNPGSVKALFVWQVLLFYSVVWTKTGQQVGTFLVSE